MSLRHSFVSFAIFSCGLIATSFGCGGGSDDGGEAAALCEKEDACGNTPSPDEIAACKKDAERCTAEADDVAVCSEGNLECVDESSSIKSGECEDEIGAYLACMFLGG